MEEQFILRVPPSVAERIEHLLNDNPSSSSEYSSLDLSFTGVGVAHIGLYACPPLLMRNECYLRLFFSSFQYCISNSINSVSGKIGS
ncbi:hypothetical protein KSP40_PGU017885 [Platanthera guangdongensis]|uniref:Uncharacterized protein n=1 Tax=Platanthera guangdongensis TaxID=2320717 RepID=A0ABR2MUR9_9ASPA